MAFTYIPPRKVQANPLLSGISGIVDTLNQLQDKKKDNEQNRLNNIFKLADNIDFFSAISAENQRQQFDIYKGLVQGLTDITKNNIDRDGNVSIDGKLQQRILFQQAAKNMEDIKLGQEEYLKTSQEYAKNPNKYLPERYNEYSANYLQRGSGTNEKGEKIRGLVERPVPPELWMRDIKGKKGESVQDFVGGKKIERTQYMSPEERRAVYDQMVNANEGNLTGMLEAFDKESGAEKDQYLKSFEDPIKAAIEWGFNEKASKFIAPDVVSETAYKETGENKSQPISATKKEDGSIAWRTQMNAKPINGPLEVYSDKGMLAESVVSNGKVVEVGYGKIPGGGYDSYIKVLVKDAGQEEGMPLSEDASALAIVGKFLNAESQKNYKVVTAPYKPYSQMIKGSYNLEGIDSLDNMKGVTPKKEKVKKETLGKWDKYKIK